jgi:type I restriction enzyme S subunit
MQYFNSPVWHKTINEICAEGARNHGLLNVSPDDFFATIHHFAPTKEEQDRSHLSSLSMTRKLIIR